MSESKLLDEWVRTGDWPPTTMEPPGGWTPPRLVAAIRAEAAGVTLAPGTDRLRAALTEIAAVAVNERDYPPNAARSTINRFARAALAATPEPTPAPPALDAAWAEAEAMLPEGWVITDVVRRAVDGPRAWRAIAHDWPYLHEGHAGMGATPIAALQALTAELWMNTTTEPQATKPPNSDQYDVVIPEPRT